MAFSRRDFLKTGAAGLTALVMPPGLSAAARAGSAQRVLVALYLRGGADGLNLVVPAGDSVYYDLRPTVQIPAGTELGLDDFFGFNPALAPLLPLYQSGELAVIHACGNPQPGRSHFAAQDDMELAAPGVAGVNDGWLNRALLVSGGGQPIEGVSLSEVGALSLAGSAPALALGSIEGYRLEGESVAARRAALTARYAQIPGSLLGSSALDAFSALDLIEGVDTDTSVVYPAESELSDALRNAAALIRAEIGVRVITVDVGGWDHHTDTVGRMPDNAADLAASLAAFQQDLGGCAATTLTLCMSEFGRRAEENGALGTEHGRAGAMIAIGGGLGGGRVLLRHDTWPGLGADQLDNGQDLAVTTDFRNVFAEVLHRHLGIPVASLAPVFPGFAVDASEFPGLWL